MAQKLTALDIVSLVLTIVATILQCYGYFSPHWWEHKDGNDVSHVAMLTMTMCGVSCNEKSVLSLEKDREWIFAARVFGVFGVFFVLFALVIGFLMVIVRRRLYNTLTVYILATAAMFILVAVVIFGAFNDVLNNNLEGKGRLLFEGIGICSLAAVCCVVSSVVAGFALRRHLQEWDDDDDK